MPLSLKTAFQLYRLVKTQSVEHSLIDILFYTTQKLVKNIAQCMDLKTSMHRLIFIIVHCRRWQCLALSMVTVFNHQKRLSYGKLSLEISLTDRKSTRLNSSHVSISYAVF